MNRKLLNLPVSIRLLIAASAFVLITNAWAGTITYTGNTTGGPTYNRPLAGTPPSGLSAVGTAVRYSTQQFTVDVTGSYTFQNTATNPPLWDNFTFLYMNSFVPGSPLANVLIGNDDNATIGLSGFTINLTGGTSYLFVTTGFSNTDFGTFSNVITGPGNISLAGSAAVPEGGAAFGLFGLALASLAFVRARSRAVA